jgi:tetrapyrrole methylase family protein/MazG family protein
MSHFAELENIMKRLRAKDGCPWDIEQTHESLKICLMEETAEVLEAIDSKEDALLLEELGDLLLQVVFHSQIASEEDRFSLQDVVQGISHKLIRRHPHVFGDTNCQDADAVLTQWEAIKKEEKKVERQSAMDGIPNYLGALHYAEKAIKKAKKGKFDSTKTKLSSDLLSKAAEGNASNEELTALLFQITNQIQQQDGHSEELLRTYTNQFIAECRDEEKNG